MRKIAQCSPGVVELVLIPLRQRLEERQRRQKLGVGSLQVGLLSLVIGMRQWDGVGGGIGCSPDSGGPCCGDKYEDKVPI